MDRMHDVALLSASPEDLFGFTSSFPRLKMLLPWIIHISRTNLLKTSQLLSIASTFFHSTQCIPYCSYLSNSSPHTWLLWWNEHSEGKKPCFERKICRAILQSLCLPHGKRGLAKHLPKLERCAGGAGVELQWSWALKHLKEKYDVSCFDCFCAFTHSTLSFFKQVCANSFQLCISSCFIIKKTWNIVNRCLLLHIFYMTYTQFSCL